MEGLEAAVHIMLVLMTSRGVVAAAAKAPAEAPVITTGFRQLSLIADVSSMDVKFVCTGEFDHLRHTM